MSPEHSAPQKQAGRLFYFFALHAQGRLTPLLKHLFEVDRHF